MILAMGIFHVHCCEEEGMVCQDCVEHVKHNAHIGQASIMDFDCVLCKILHTDYTTPEVQAFLAVALLAFAITACPIQDIVHRKATLPSLRAPPVVG